MNEWNDITVITPVADIDIATVPQLRTRIDDLIVGGCRRIIVNCQNVSFVDSTGLAFLLTRARRLTQAEGLLTLVNASPEVVRFLQIARLIDVLHVSGTQSLPVPVLSPDAMPRWSKSFSVHEGVENLGYYRHRLVELLESVPMSREACFDVALATSEALGNAYDHATGEGGVLTVRAYDDRVVIEVTDRGEGFEIAADEEPDESEERGRGIKLMRMLVDSVEVRRRVDVQGTYVRLVKLL